MEEWVGGLWDRFITRVARRDHPEAAVHLADIEKVLGVLFRALGGDPGLRVAAAADTRHGARRRLLERVAGTGEKAAHATLDLETLRLPATLAWFPERHLNRDLYLWLIALAAAAGPAALTAREGRDFPLGAWLQLNQAAVLRALERFPGLVARYRRLVEAVIAERLDPKGLPADEAAREQAMRRALLEPGTVASLPAPAGRRSMPLQPVPLWLYPAPAAKEAPTRRARHHEREESSGIDAGAEKRHHEAERTELPDLQRRIHRRPGPGQRAPRHRAA